MQYDVTTDSITDTTIAKYMMYSSKRSQERCGKIKMKKEIIYN